MTRKIGKIRSYASGEQAIEVRTAACDFASRLMSEEDFDSGRLMALCVFFERWSIDVRHSASGGSLRPSRALTADNQMISQPVGRLWPLALLHLL